MSAPRASETPSTANPFLRDLVASLRTVQLPGNPATYANRAALREMGLRWDPAGHRWHGTTTAAAVKTLREPLRLEVRVFGVLEGGAPKGPTAPKPAPTRPAPLLTAPLPHDGLQTNPSNSSHPRSFVPGTRTHLERRIALPTLGDEPEEFRTAGRTFTLWETTSGHPDDSREADEKAAERQLRDLRARVKRARAIVATTPGLAETLQADWKRAARFYVRQGVTESQFRRGVPPCSHELSFESPGEVSVWPSGSSQRV